MKNQFTKTPSAILFALGVFVLCCNGFGKKTDKIAISKPKVTVYYYRIWLSNLDRKNLKDSVITYIDTLNLYNRKNYIYAIEPFKKNAYVESYSIVEDSFFLYHEFCENISELELSYKSDKIKLIVSDFDEECCADEESYIYWNKRYGLLAIYNYASGMLILFDREDIKGFSKNTLYDYIIEIEKGKKRTTLLPSNE